MDFLLVALVAGGTFGLCYLADKGFTKVFRGKAQHQSGLSVRLSKHYGALGLVLVTLGIAAIFAGLGKKWALSVGGGVISLVGIGLIVYYMTFGVFYDKSSFILTTFGKKSTAYRYGDIVSQQLYSSYGNIVIELTMNDGRTVPLQAGMNGVYPFLDKAFAGWCTQKGLQPEDCPFHDPQNSCWFPTREEN